jgi:hypothetical protein
VNGTCGGNGHPRRAATIGNDDAVPLCPRNRADLATQETVDLAGKRPRPFVPAHYRPALTRLQTVSGAERASRSARVCQQGGNLLANPRERQRFANDEWGADTDTTSSAPNTDPLRDEGVVQGSPRRSTRDRWACRGGLAVAAKVQRPEELLLLRYLAAGRTSHRSPAKSSSSPASTGTEIGRLGGVDRSVAW